MKKKLLTLFTLVALLTAFSIPLMQCTTSISATQNTLSSPIAKTVPAGGSIEWQVQLKNAVGQSIAVTSNESYIYVGGANWTDPTNISSWQPILWKYNNSGSRVWNTTINVQGCFLNAFNVFNSVALSPDNSSVYALGNLYNGSAYPSTLVKFDTANGNYIWNYTISSGGVYNLIYSVEVSPDSETVYLAATLFKSSNINFNSSFYVATIKASDGTLDWSYELYLNGSYDYGYARDLALSPDGGVLYALGFYTVLYNWTNGIDLVAIDTSSHSQLWNRTTSYGFGIDFFDISSDGNKIYAIEYPGNLVTIDTSNGNTIENVSISNQISPRGLSLSFNESNLYILTSQLNAHGQNLPTLMVELNSSGTVTGVIVSHSSQTIPYGLAPANDNESVYVVGSKSDLLNDKYSMFLLKGKAGPIPLPSPPILPLLLYAMLSQSRGLSPQVNYSLAGIGIAAALIVASFLIARTLRGKRVENV